MEKLCPVCGKKFECTHDINCWCTQIVLSENTQKELKKRYSDCLCKDCLTKMEAAEKINFAK